ncbi:MAG: YfbR-like 5'-deoxynucleotidase [Nanoarchaeota archaeon]
MLTHEEIESLGFKGRLEALRKIKRWKQFSPAFYRHDLEMHSLELLYIFNELESIIKEIFPNLDLEKTRTLILVHDDPETISLGGDVTYDRKLNMTEKEKHELEIEEEKAIEELLKIWPETINGYSYKELLLMAKEKNTVEAQLLSYIDKFSALCESLHELHAGNIGFHEGWQTERDRPPVAGNNIVNLIPKYNLISEFLKINHPIIIPYKRPNVKSLLESVKPHTKDSIFIPTGLAHYDFWKFTILKHGKEKALNWLTQQREFL